MIQLLLDDVWAPITSEIGFLHCDVLTASTCFAEWEDTNLKRRGGKISSQWLSGNLEEHLQKLLPLTSIEAMRFLFVSCGRGAWTAFFSNGKNGTDAMAPMSELALRLKCRGVRMVCTPHTVRKQGGVFKGRHGANILEVYAPRQTDFLNYERSICVINEDNGWQFEASGQEFPFENVNQYASKNARDRFTDVMLKEYLAHLGIEAFDINFYNSERAVLIARQGILVKGMQEFSLAQVRAKF